MYHFRKNDAVNIEYSLIKSVGRTSWNKMELFEWVNKEGRKKETNTWIRKWLHGHLCSSKQPKFKCPYWDAPLGPGVAKMSKTKPQPLQNFGVRGVPQPLPIHLNHLERFLSTTTQVLSFPRAIKSDLLGMRHQELLKLPRWSQL